MAIYLTSDWHFCHNQPFLYEPRGFKNIEEMNDIISKIDFDNISYIKCLGKEE